MDIDGPNRRAGRVPILGLAALAVAGTLAGLHLSWWWALCCAPPAAYAAWSRRLAPLACGLWALAYFATAWLAANPLSPNHLANLLERPREATDLIGVIDAEPAIFVRADGSETNLFVPLRVEAINRDGRWRRASGDTQIACFGWTPTLRFGDRVRVRGEIAVRDGAGAMLRRTTHRVSARTAVVLKRNQGNLLLTRCYQLRHWAGRTLSVGLGERPEHAGVLRAMMLGYRQDLPELWQTWFARTGTMHVFAISGLHVGILAGLIVLVLRFVGVSRLHYVAFLAPLLLIFVLTTGLKASAIRAGIMAVMYWLGPFLRRRPDSRAALALSVIVILAWAPHQLLSPGFLMSVSIVAGILVLYPVLYAPLRRLGLPDPWALTEDTTVFRLRKWLAGWFAGLAAMSASAWLVSAPLTALFFNTLSPGGLLGNLVVVPLAGLIVWTAAATLVFGAVWTPAAEFGNAINSGLVSVLVRTTEVLHAIPGAWQFVQAPPLFGLALYYLALMAVVWRRRLGVWMWAALIAVLLGYGARFALAPSEPRIDFLALREGQTELLRAPGQTVLFDTGPSFQFQRVAAHLRRCGVDRIDTLLLSHADADHIGAVPELLEVWPVRRIVVPDTPRSTPSMDQALAAATARGIPVERWSRGREEWFGQRLYVSVFHPRPEEPTVRADDHSLVLRIEAEGGFSVLLCGGAGSDVEAEILATGLEPAATFVHLGNTMDAGVGSVEWLEELESDLAIAPPRTWVREGNPNHGLAERLRDADSDLLRLDQEGTLRLDLRRGVVELVP